MAARWLAEASSSTGDSYIGHAYTVCSIRTSDPSQNGRASGYVLKVLHHYKLDDGTAVDADGFSTNGVATQFTMLDGAQPLPYSTLRRCSLSRRATDRVRLRPQLDDVTTDKADYAPGSMATFMVAGANSGARSHSRSPTWPAPPGNGIADVYRRSVSRRAARAMPTAAVVAKWQVPAMAAPPAPCCSSPPLRQPDRDHTFSDAPNKIVSENLNAGTPKSVWRSTARSPTTATRRSRALRR